MTTGFRAYHIYSTIKHIYYRSKKYDISTMPLPKKEMFLKKWNNEMIHKRDSLLFLKLDTLYNDEQLIRMFSYYFFKNNNFYITDIMDDEFHLFRKMEYELLSLKEVIERDFYFIINVAIKYSIPIKKMFIKENGLPPIFKIFDKGKISINSLVAFDIAFDLKKNLDQKAVNIVEEEKIKTYQKVLDKYSHLIYNNFTFDVREFLTSIYNNILKVKEKTNN